MCGLYLCVLCMVLSNSMASIRYGKNVKITKCLSQLGMENAKIAKCQSEIGMEKSKNCKMPISNKY